MQLYFGLRVVVEVVQDFSHAQKRFLRNCFDVSATMATESPRLEKAMRWKGTLGRWKAPLGKSAALERHPGSLESHRLEKVERWKGVLGRWKAPAWKK